MTDGPEFEQGAFTPEGVIDWMFERCNRRQEQDVVNHDATCAFQYFARKAMLADFMNFVTAAAKRSSQWDAWNDPRPSNWWKLTYKKRKWTWNQDYDYAACSNRTTCYGQWRLVKEPWPCLWKFLGLGLNFPLHGRSCLGCCKTPTWKLFTRHVMMKDNVHLNLPVDLQWECTTWWWKFCWHESVFTNHTLAHPLNCRGGVVARLSA